ncbi:hypothetical protein [Bradyrhizobium sp. S3.7.6]
MLKRLDKKARDQARAAEKAAAKDPPSLALVLKNHPELSRAEALEMIEAMGG